MNIYCLYFEFSQNDVTTLDKLRQSPNYSAVFNIVLQDINDNVDTELDFNRKFYILTIMTMFTN